MKRLFLVGDGASADRLGELAGMLGYDAIIRCDLPSAPLGPSDHVVLCPSDHRSGRALLARTLDAGDPGYVGLIATAEEASSALARLSAAGVAAERLERIHAPAGVAVGAETADEQAIAVAAELIAVAHRI